MAGDKITVGNAEIISIHDLDLNFPSAMVFPNLTPEDFDAYRDLYPDCFGKIGLFADCGGFVIRSSGKTILVDTGFGPGPIAMLGGLEGHLADDLREKGVPPESIDIVIHTHLHVDHVGWNIGPDGKPNFPKAKYYAPKGDLEFFANTDMNPHMNQVLPLRDMGLLEPYSGEITLTQEVTTVPTPGHTPDHHSVLVNSGGEKILITGDLAHHPAQVDKTDWCPSFDIDHPLATATRTKMFDQLEAEGMLAAFCHFPGAGFGHIVRKGNQRVFQAL